MTQLNDTEHQAVITQLPVAEPQLSRAECVHSVEEVSEQFPDNKIPLLIPRGANRAAFTRIGEEVQQFHKRHKNGLEDVSLYDFWLDVWQIYTKTYGTGDVDVSELEVTIDE